MAGETDRMKRIRDEGSSSYSRTDDHGILHLIHLRKWDVAVERMKTEDVREDLIRRGWNGRHPLCDAISLGAPLELTEAMVGYCPEAVRLTDRDGYLPLHYACVGSLGFISPQVVRLLLRAYPEGAKATNNYEELPLHYAARRKAPIEVLTMLIDVHPEGAATPNGSGKLPVHLIDERSSPNKKEDVDKVEVLLRPLLDDGEACLASYASDIRSRHTPLHIGAKFDLLDLHTCLRVLRCPTELILTIAKRHPGQLHERDQNGSLPLHLAAANPSLNGVRDGPEELIGKFVRLYPEAAGTPDGEGRFPLSLAIESGKRWKEGVEAIFDAAPFVISIRDEATGLYPFMLAATVHNSRITAVYSLLRPCPELKRYTLD